jgi:hypothetical protein
MRLGSPKTVRADGEPSSARTIKAALLLAQPDKRLLKAYLEIRGADQRYKQEPWE